MAVKSPDPYDFVLHSCVITASRLDKTYNITNLVQEAQFYENIENVHIHGNITFIDSNNVFETIDFSGTEILDISYFIPDSPSSKWKGRFIINKVLKTQKGNDNVEAITLQLVDYDTYWNSLINVSKSHKGKISFIMEQVLKDSFNDTKKLMYGNQEIQRPIQYLSPNITPYQILNTLKNRCSGPTGTPYYLFASLNDNSLRFFDLQEILDLPTLNTGKPYSFGTYASESNENGPPQNKSYHIAAMDTRDTEDMLALITFGAVGARYEYINTTGNYSDSYKFDAQKVFENIWNRSKQNQLVPCFDPVAAVGGKYLTDYESIVHSEVATSGTYYQMASLNEDLTDIFHRSKSISLVMKTFMRKSTISVVVPGRNFFPFEANLTIGNKIDINVLSNTDITKSMNHKQIFDQKRSGPYMILAAKHQFTGKRYSVHLKLGKLGNLTGNTQINRMGYGQGQIDPPLYKAIYGG